MPQLTFEIHTGRSLESMDLLFKATTNEQREAGIAKAHNNLEGNTEKDPEAFDPKSKDAGTSGYVEYASQRA